MIYFDNAATTYPKPGGVIRETNRTIKKCGGNPGRSSHPLAMAAADKIYETREKVCRLFDYDKPENVIFLSNATYALNLAIKTRVKPKSHILISDMEHNSVFRPVHKLARDGTVTYDIFRTDGDVIKNITEKLTPETDILICNHISNVCGRKMPVESIGSLCKQRGIYFIIDASQSAGHTNVSMRSTDANAICAPGHKGLFGLQGSGFVILKDVENLCEFTEGGSGTNSSDPYMPLYLPDRYEAGTLSTPAIAYLGAGIDFITKIGTEEIEYKESSILKRAYDMLSCFKKIKIDAPDDLHGSVISFNIADVPQVTVSRYLCDNGIYCRGGLHCAPLAHNTLNNGERGAVRLSFSYFNNPKELEKLYHILKTF